MPSFSVTSANIAISDISLKTRFFGLHFRCRKSWCIFNHFYVISPLTCSLDDLSLVPYRSSSPHSYRRQTCAAPNRMLSSSFLAPVSDCVMLPMLLQSTRRRSVLEQNAGMTVERVSGRSSQATRSLFCYPFQAIRCRKTFMGPMSWNSNLAQSTTLFRPRTEERPSMSVM